MSKKEMARVEILKRAPNAVERYLRNLNTKKTERPELFISLHDVIGRIAELNEPYSSYRDAARELGRALESDDSPPTWCTSPRYGGRGKAAPDLGSEWGDKLIANAASWGEPVQWDANVDYGHDHFETLTLPIYKFMMYGPKLGFQIAEIEPFLERHGVKVFAKSVLTNEPKQVPSRESAASHRHRIGRDVLAPMIDRACSAVANPVDSAAVWAELERLARLPEKERPAPLAGVTSGGVQWHDGGGRKTLTRRAFGDRLRRRVQPR